MELTEGFWRGGEGGLNGCGGESIKAGVRANLKPIDRGVFGRVTNGISVRRKKKAGLMGGAHCQ
jgi:hypothetical protein